MRRTFISFLGLILGLAGLAAQAQIMGNTRPLPTGPALNMTLGYFDFDDNREAASGSLEYRFSPWFWTVRPVLGAMGTTDGAGFVYGGVAADIPVGNQIIVTPSFAPGLYGRGSGKDLGQALQFKSQIELTYRFESEYRLGLGINHLSNAGLDNNNPGANTLFMTFTVPINRLFQ